MNETNYLGGEAELNSLVEFIPMIPLSEAIAGDRGIYIKCSDSFINSEAELNSLVEFIPMIR